MVNIEADTADTNGRNLRFEVVDLGLGRVALPAADLVLVDQGIASLPVIVFKDAPPHTARHFGPADA